MVANETPTSLILLSNERLLQSAAFPMMQARLFMPYSAAIRVTDFEK